MVREVHNSRKIVIGRLRLPMEPWCGSDGTAFASKLAVCPIALDPLLHGENKPAHDFLFPFPPFEDTEIRPVVRPNNRILLSIRGMLSPLYTARCRTSLTPIPSASSSRLPLLLRVR